MITIEIAPGISLSLDNTDAAIELFEKMARDAMNRNDIVYDDIFNDIALWVLKDMKQNHQATIPKNEWDADDDLFVNGCDRLIKDLTPPSW